MQKDDFLKKNQQLLQEFVRMSRTAGERSDYVQGGGGNTSCKLDGNLMAIKASGYRLDQIEKDQAYAVLDYQQLRGFYEGQEAAELADVEAAGSARAREATLNVQGLAALRPSVEAGFHSLLDTFVLHTHAVYANLATCAEDGAQMAKKALAGLEAGHVFIPYINPGAQLTFAIQAAIRQKEQESGRRPQILLLQNHGIITMAADADSCLLLHEAANERLAAAFFVSQSDWPVIDLACLAADDELFSSATPWLTKKLQGIKDLSLFISQPLYPDQMVFLAGKLGLVDQDVPAEPEAVLDLFQGRPEVCLILSETGQVFYKCSGNEARTIEQTLCAILFITATVQANGAKLISMSQAGQEFISSWESEQYRKKIAEK